jgi:hypothetical protein
VVDFKKFEPLTTLHPDVLQEVVREGEIRLQSQLQIATAADQRALTIAGFQIASATAALAGGVALAVKQGPDLLLAALALGFAGALLGAAWIAVRTVRPSKFSIPGNRPSGWLPERWLSASAKDFSLKKARIEQAACLDEAIEENDRDLERAALQIHRSVDLMLRSVAVCGAALLITIGARNFSSFVAPCPKSFETRHL